MGQHKALHRTIAIYFYPLAYQDFLRMCTAYWDYYTKIPPDPTEFVLTSSNFTTCSLFVILKYALNANNCLDAKSLVHSCGWLMSQGNQRESDVHLAPKGFKLTWVEMNYNSSFLNSPSLNKETDFRLCKLKFMHLTWKLDEEKRPVKYFDTKGEIEQLLILCLKELHNFAPIVVG